MQLIANEQVVLVERKYYGEPAVVLSVSPSGQRAVIQ